MLEQPRHLESADLDGFRAGDICVYRTPKGTWRPLWILRIERVTGTDERAVHYQIYRAYADEQPSSVTADEIAGMRIASLHVPIMAERFLEAKPQVVGYRAVADANLEGYRVWRVEWDKGEAGVFSLPLAEIA